MLEINFNQSRNDLKQEILNILSKNENFNEIRSRLDNSGMFFINFLYDLKAFFVLKVKISSSEIKPSYILEDIIINNNDLFMLFNIKFLNSNNRFKINLKAIDDKYDIKCYIGDKFIGNLNDSNYFDNVQSFGIKNISHFLNLNILKDNIDYLLNSPEPIQKCNLQYINNLNLEEKTKLLNKTLYLLSLDKSHFEEILFKHEVDDSYDSFTIDYNKLKSLKNESILNEISSFLSSFSDIYININDMQLIISLKYNFTYCNLLNHVKNYKNKDKFQFLKDLFSSISKE